MEHNNNERRLVPQMQQQATQVWSAEFVNHMERATAVPPALSALGLGEAAAYLTAHTEYLAASLNHSNWAIRAAAVQVVGKQGTAIEPLLHALHDEHVSVRATAARALGIQGERVPVEPLINALHDPEWRVRTASAQALGRLKNKTPIEPLLPVLHDENEAVRAAVVWALGAMGKRVPVEHLVTALQDKAWSVREAAAMALQEQGEMAPMGSLLAARWDEDRSVREAVDVALEHRFDGQEGQKLVPASASWLSSPWQRLALAGISVGMVIPISSILLNRAYIGRFALISEVVAIALVCIVIAVINVIYQRKPIDAVSIAKRGTTNSWHGVILAGGSVLVLASVASNLLQTSFAYDPLITTDIVHYVLVCRLIALGFMALTVVVVNKVFFGKH